MHWWNKVFLIEATMASNYIFATLSSFFGIFNVINMQRNKWCICNIFINANNKCKIFILWHYDTKLAPNYWDGCVEKWLWINSMGLNSTLADYKTNNSSEYPNYHQNIDMSHQNIAKDYHYGPLFKTLICPTKNRMGLNQWHFVPLVLTLIYTTESIIQTLTTNTWWLFFQNIEMPHQNITRD